MLNGKISLVHEDVLKIALGDLLLIATCSTAWLSHSVLLQREEHPGTANELPDTYTVYKLRHFYLFRCILEHLM